MLLLARFSGNSLIFTIDSRGTQRIGSPYRFERPGEGSKRGEEGPLGGDEALAAACPPPVKSLHPREGRTVRGINCHCRFNLKCEPRGSPAPAGAGTSQPGAPGPSGPEAIHRQWRTSDHQSHLRVPLANRKHDPLGTAAQSVPVGSHSNPQTSRLGGPEREQAPRHFDRAPTHALGQPAPPSLNHGSEPSRIPAGRASGRPVRVAGTDAPAPPAGAGLSAACS